MKRSATALVLPLLLGCAHARTQPRATTAPSTAQAPRVGAAARFPASGCTPGQSAVAAFASRETALDALVTASAIGAEASPRALDDGPVHFQIPGEWFASRVDGRDFTIYRLRTGDEGDLFTLYLGNQPPFRERQGHEFRRAHEGVLTRGTLFRDDRRWRMEALSLLPCAQPRHVYFSAHTDAPAQLARFVSVLRSLRVTAAGVRVGPVTLEAARDGTAVHALTNDHALTALLDQALDAGGLSARYPLDTTHPLADQLLAGRARVRFGAVDTELWLTLDVAQRAIAPSAAFRSVLSDAAGITAALAPLAPEPCAMVVARDGVSLRCGGAHPADFRVAIDEPDAERSVARAIERARAAKALLARWSADPSVGLGYAQSVCAIDATRPISVASEASVMGVRVGRCALATDAELRTVRALAVEGQCSQVAAAPWSTALRTVGRFAELGSTAARGQCRYTLGATTAGAWVFAADDQETASGPIGAGPSMGADRAAVRTAVSTMYDVLSYATGQRADRPEHVSNEAAAALGLRNAGSAEWRALLRRLFTLGGVEGATPVAVLGARAVSAEQVEVRFLAYTLLLGRQADGAWQVRGARATDF